VRLASVGSIGRIGPINRGLIVIEQYVEGSINEGYANCN